MISLQRVSARAGGFTLSDVSFDVPDGGYGVVIGPAGSGKTTLLETIAGVIRPTSGRILLGGKDVTTAPPEARRLGIVYQHAYLFPHLNVRANIAYGAADDESAADMSDRFGVTAMADRAVEALSGGERQLVAMARALARRPGVLLLDEPDVHLHPDLQQKFVEFIETVAVEFDRPEPSAGGDGRLTLKWGMSPSS